MEEEKLVERPLMSEEEFKEYIDSNKEEAFRKGFLTLKDYFCVHKFKSVRRAIKRGHISLLGDIYPRKPYNNRKNTSKRPGVHSRTLNELKRRIYGAINKKSRVQ